MLHLARGITLSKEGYETSVITKLFITHSDTYTVVALGNMELDGGEQQEEE